MYNLRYSYELPTFNASKWEQLHENLNFFFVKYAKKNPHKKNLRSKIESQFEVSIFYIIYTNINNNIFLLCKLLSLYFINFESFSERTEKFVKKIFFSMKFFKTFVIVSWNCTLLSVDNNTFLYLIRSINIQRLSWWMIDFFFISEMFISSKLNKYH